MLIKSLYTALLLLVMFAIGFVCQAAAHLLHIPLDLTANKGAGQVLLYLIVIGTLLAFTMKIWKQDILAAVRPYGANWGRVGVGFSTCAGLSLLLQLPIYGLLFHAGILNISDYARHKQIPVMVFNIIISQLVMVVLATSEEGIFRGFLFNYLRSDAKKGHVVAAVVISSIIFGLSHEFHTLNHWLEPAYYGKLIGLIILGVLLAVTYYSTRSIACSIGVHASLLWLDEVRRVTMDLHQPYWWTGTNNDLRTAPFVWLIFLALTVGFGIGGKRLRPLVAIELRDEDVVPTHAAMEENSISPASQSSNSYKAATTAE